MNLFVYRFYLNRAKAPTMFRKSAKTHPELNRNQICYSLEIIFRTQQYGQKFRQRFEKIAYEINSRTHKTNFSSKDSKSSCKNFKIQSNHATNPK